MTMNRVQFQPGLSLPMFLRQYGSERACEQALLRAHWREGFMCPICAERTASTFLRAGTILDNTKLPLTTWLLALYLLTQSKTNLAALELMRHLGVCCRTAWRLKHKLIQAMASREATRQLGALVQIDDAYLGGERTGGKPGRGSENKRPFVIAVEVSERGHPRQAVITAVPGFTRVALAHGAACHLRPAMDIFSDGLGAFRAVIDAGHAHIVIESGGGRAATESDGARWVNVVLSNLKRALDGTYHAFGFFKYADRYLAEAAWRFSRRFHLDALVPRLLVAGAHCTPWPESRLRDLPVRPAESQR